MENAAIFSCYLDMCRWCLAPRLNAKSDPNRMFTTLIDNLYLQTAEYCKSIQIHKRNYDNLNMIEN